jgi:hypothetical protein
MKEMKKSKGDQREVDPMHQAGLELGQVDVEGPVKTERGHDGGNDLANRTIEIGVGGPWWGN